MLAEEVEAKVTRADQKLLHRVGTEKKQMEKFCLCIDRPRRSRGHDGGFCGCLLLVSANETEETEQKVRKVKRVYRQDV